ncbi:MAG: glycosyltransferase [Oscillospiraceae bacterium]|nr:glycosyltransferase [Oscillospiraceae bacterium]
MKNIVCLSTSAWFPYPTRKQQVMSRLSDSRIIYFNPPVTYIARFKDPKAAALAKEWKKGAVKATDSVTVYSIPPVIPFFNRCRLINKINQKRLSRYVKKVLKAEGVKDYLLWCYSPTSADIIDHLDHKGLVYDCVDRHSAYPGFIDPQVVDGMEKDLASKADMVFSTAKGLHEVLSGYNKNSVMIPNGANFELFNKASKPSPEKGPLDHIEGPVLGFVGTMQQCIDLDLVENAARRHPEWTFVMIGSQLPGAVSESIKTCKNVIFTGLVPHDKLPDYVRRFDLCLNLFRNDPLSKDVSPLKFYEYLATGKPIVSTLMPDQVLDYEGAVYIARTNDEFEELCGKALDENDPALTAQRITWGRESSWDSRVRQMENILSEKGIF